MIYLRWSNYSRFFVTVISTVIETIIFYNVVGFSGR